jgi:molecular chaperone HtpG
MMPIIKKWLYSDKDIFLREIVANAIDAITKFKKLVNMNEAQDNQTEYCVKINVDKDTKTITAEDNGIGMTEDEVEKYITQIAFSGASDFLQKYEKAGGDGIIGHFGLGFYSAYMVSDTVTIITKSYKDEPAVKWESDGNSTYTIDNCDKAEHGTCIIMHIAEGEEEFLDEFKIKELVEKYCSFMPYNIYVNFKGDGKDKPLNTTNPLYTKKPKDCTDDEYKEFYTKTFKDYDEPMFWVHLDMDYPVNLKGILYFPKVKNKMELERGKIKLYCNQVFIADNVKEIIPDYLMLLNGVIDCPEIPLNVSRSFLQNDKQIQRISKYIVKKVADKLNATYKDDKEKYEAIWSDVANFVKFGCIKDNDFYDKIKDSIIYKDLNGEYKTIEQFYEAAKSVENNKKEEAAGETNEATDEANAKKDETKDEPVKIYYVSDSDQQAQYIKMFKSAGMNAMICDIYIDPHFVTYLEYKDPAKYKFLRIDSDIANALKSDGQATDENVVELFKKVLNNDKLTIKAQSMKDQSVPAVIVVDEYSRRYSEMGKMYGMGEGDLALTLMVNTANSIVQNLANVDENDQSLMVNYIYSLALLSFKKLNPDELDKFVGQSLELLTKSINNKQQTTKKSKAKAKEASEKTESDDKNTNRKVT